MRLSLSIVLVIALIGITQIDGAQINENDYDVMFDDQDKLNDKNKVDDLSGLDEKNWFDDKDEGMFTFDMLTPLQKEAIQNGDEIMNPIVDEDLMQAPPEIDDTPQKPIIVDNGESYEELLAANSPLLREIVKEGSLDMNIFPREDEMDKSMFLSEKELNLSSSRCSIPIYMPNRGGKHAAPGTRWVRIHSRHWLYATVCHTSWGDLPGFYWGGYCYFAYGGHMRRTCRWDWTGLVNGRNYLVHSCHRDSCTIFGGYQKGYKNPLFLCVARHGHWLIPGKADVYRKLCWYGHDWCTRAFYWVVSR